MGRPKSKLSPEQETELAQEWLDGYKNFAPGDTEPTIDGDSKSWQRRLESRYLDGWKDARDNHQSEQQALDPHPEVDTRQMTAKQGDYLTDLLQEHRIKWSQAQDQLRAMGVPNPPEMEKLPRPQAGALIDWLTTSFPRRQCGATTKKGDPCQNLALLLQPNCSQHKTLPQG